MDQDTAIPIDHSMPRPDAFINPVDTNAVDKAIAELAETPGWKLYEASIRSEIERLQDTEKSDSETMENYGLRVYAAQLCRQKLAWAIGSVRGTAESVANAGGDQGVS